MSCRIFSVCLALLSAVTSCVQTWYWYCVRLVVLKRVVPPSTMDRLLNRTAPPVAPMAASFWNHTLVETLPSA